ncbi:hypothetical protein BKA64DRAFT_703681 [Cadophora sp. MPI-SDFR-AT-0126]|nr:hypothetical protein BKA64DRAFT_703681 [Leotiomycetes sp. MPI-SDFR-AT-0126]
MFQKVFRSRKPKAQTIQLGDLPEELLIHILSYLSSWDYLALAHTSRGYQAFIIDNAREICLEAMKAQPDIATYTVSMTIDKHTYSYLYRLGWFLTRRWFGSLRRYLRPWEITHLPMFIGYLEKAGRSLGPELSSAYARHILGEIIEIG